MAAPALVTTVAGTTANTYASASEADIYLAERGPSTWDELDAEAKVRKLIQAARIIDRYPFDGFKHNTGTSRIGGYPGQSLAFPRSIDVDSAGDPFVPEEVKEAQVEVAFVLATSRESAMPSAPSVKSISVGSMSATFESGDSQCDRIVRQFIGNRIAASAEMI
jgi:hypothetical protein